MPYKDREKSNAAARERKRRWRAKNRPDDWADMRGKHNHHASGSNHPRWNNGSAIGSNGYIRISIGKDHPLADPNGYAYLHLLVWVTSGNPKPKEGEVIHHINRDKTDNRLENLQLLTKSEHAHIHLVKPKDGVYWQQFPEAL